MKQIQIHLVPAIFCLFIFGMTTLLLLPPYGDYSEKEKRYLADAPSISAFALLDGSTQDELELWLSDHLPGRDFYIGMNAYRLLAMGQGALQDVYYAKDGYLIAAPEALNLQTFETNLKRFNDFAVGTELPTSVIIIPTVGYLKQELLPRGHAAYHDETLFSLADSLLPDVAFFDPREALRIADQEASVCYRTDHHLTSFGNYALHQSWRRGQGLFTTTKECFSVETHGGFYGTAWSGSGYWLTASDDIELWDSGASVTVTITDGDDPSRSSDSLFYRDHLEELDQYPVFLDGNHALVKIENPTAERGTLLCIRDSYAHCFATFLAQEYQEVYLIDLRYYRGSITDLIAENNVKELLFLYGVNNLMLDTNSAWLF